MFARFDERVGLDDVRDQLFDVASDALAAEQRREKGRPTRPRRHHMLFAGPAGTGKTTTARDVADLMSALGVIPKQPGKNPDGTPANYTELLREDLVGAYEGQSALKTAEALEAGKGGVIFIDEAYALKTDDRDMFGTEIVNTLLTFMENNYDDTVVILGGYPEDMKKLIGSNQGLSSRIPITVNFPKFTPQETGDIANNLRLFEARTASPKVKRALMDAAGQFTDGNAREVENLYAAVTRVQHRRIAGKVLGGEKISDDDVDTITMDDVREGVARYRQQREVAGAGKKGSGAS